MDKSSEIAGVPLEIHFIWAGGNNPLPQQNMETIALWASQNPEFTITLWVDEKSSSQNYEAINAQYRESFKAAYLKVCGKEDAVVPDVLKVKDIRREKVCIDGDIADYELTRLLPNYGASSDILRYRILFKLGGVYLDSDVSPSRNSIVWLLKKLENDYGLNQSKTHFICINNASQVTPKRLLAQPELLDSFRKPANDALICTSGGNPMAMQLLKIVEQENYMLAQCYRDSGSEALLSTIIKVTYFSHNKKTLTIEMTGPDALVDVIKENRFGVLKTQPNLHKTVEINDERADVHIIPLISKDYQIVEPVINVKNITHFESPNRDSWLETKIDFSRFETIQTIYESLCKTISFEQEHFGCFRLPDHLQAIRDVCAHYNKDPNTSCAEFIHLLTQLKIINTEKLYCVQLRNLDPLTSKFYKDNNLSQKNFLNSKHSDKIFEYATSSVELQSTCFSKEILNNSRFKPEFWKSMVTESLPLQEAINIFHKIKIGIEFMDFLIENQGVYSDRFPINTIESMLLHYVLILNKSGELLKDLKISTKFIGVIRENIANILSRIKDIPTYKEKLKAINSQAITLFKQDKFSEAFTIFQSALSDASNVLGKNSDEVATLLYNMSSCLIRQEKFQDAIPLLEECTNIRNRVFGIKHSQTIKAQQKLDETKVIISKISLK